MLSEVYIQHVPHNTRPVPPSLLPSFPPGDTLALKLRENAQRETRSEIKRKAFRGWYGVVSRRQRRELQQKVVDTEQQQHMASRSSTAHAAAARSQQQQDTKTFARVGALQAIEASVHALSATQGKALLLLDVISTERNSSRDDLLQIRRCCDNLVRTVVALLEGGGGGSGGGGVRSWDAMLRQQDALVSDKLFGARRTTDVLVEMQKIVARLVIDAAEAGRGCHRSASAGEEGGSAHGGGRGDASWSGNNRSGSGSGSGTVPKVESTGTVPKRPQHQLSPHVPTHAVSPRGGGFVPRSRGYKHAGEGGEGGADLPSHLLQVRSGNNEAFPPRGKNPHPPLVVGGDSSSSPMLRRHSGSGGSGEFKTGNTNKSLGVELVVTSATSAVRPLQLPDVEGGCVDEDTASTIAAAAADAAAKTGTGTNGAVTLSVDELNDWATSSELQAEEGRGEGESGNDSKAWSSPFARQEAEQRGHKETLRQRQELETKRTGESELEVC